MTFHSWEVVLNSIRGGGKIRPIHWLWKVTSELCFDGICCFSGLCFSIYMSIKAAWIAPLSHQTELRGAWESRTPEIPGKEGQGGGARAEQWNTCPRCGRFQVQLLAPAEGSRAGNGGLTPWKAAAGQCRWCKARWASGMVDSKANLGLFGEFSNNLDHQAMRDVCDCVCVHW